MTAAAEMLAQADACHDHDPERAAAWLRTLAPEALPAGERPRCAFLLNHVLGEKLGDWDAALQGQQRLLALADADAPPVLWRQAAVAAAAAGQAELAATLTAELARRSGATVPQAAALVQLAGASFRVPGADATGAAQMTLSALSTLDDAAWQSAGPLDAGAAAMCNNLAADLGERPVEQLRDPTLRQALLQAARASQRLWQRAGEWLQHERAHYGVAVAANAAGEPASARQEAAAGLALLDAHDTAGQEHVDRAFLELELAHALARLGRSDEAAAARRRAEALAGAFGDAALGDWFRARQARQQQLDAG